MAKTPTYAPRTERQAFSGPTGQNVCLECSHDAWDVPVSAAAPHLILALAGLSGQASAGPTVAFPMIALYRD